MQHLLNKMQPCRMTQRTHYSPLMRMRQISVNQLHITNLNHNAPCKRKSVTNHPKCNKSSDSFHRSCGSTDHPIHHEAAQVCRSPQKDSSQYLSIRYLSFSRSSCPTSANRGNPPMPHQTSASPSSSTSIKSCFANFPALKAAMPRRI